MQEKSFGALDIFLSLPKNSKTAKPIYFLLLLRIIDTKMSITIADVSVQSPRFIRASWGDLTIGIVTGIFTRILFEVIRTYCSIFPTLFLTLSSTDRRKIARIDRRIDTTAFACFAIMEIKYSASRQVDLVDIVIVTKFQEARSRQVHAKYVFTKNKSKPVESLTRKLPLCPCVFACNEKKA